MVNVRKGFVCLGTPNSQQVQFCIRKARTTGLIPQLPKTVASMGTGSGSPAPVGKHRPGNFKPQVWEYSPRVRGCALQSGAVGRTSQRLHPLHHCCCPHSVRYYTWQMQSWEREKKMLFFPLTNTQVRVSHCSEVQQINFTCLTECRSAFCHC